MRYKTLWLLLFFLFCTAVIAAEDEETELAKKSQNPLEFMTTIPFANYTNYGFGPRRNTQDVLYLRPVFPFRLGPSWNLITRTIIPIVHQPNLLGKGYINGLGDINPDFFFSPSSTGDFSWGLGPVFILPTATQQQLGQGKYSLGPSLVLLFKPGKWVVGAIVNNAWSIGGESSRPYVNQFYMQYFINYNISHGWYAVTSPIITADWTQNTNNRWTVPLGGGLGKLLLVGKQPITVSIQAYGNVVKPQAIGPNWQLELNLTFLFPEKK